MSTTEETRRSLSPDVARTLALPEYRIEGRHKVTGGARYTADVRMPGMLWARFLGSPVPHARIVSVNTSAAKAVPGIHAVLTGQDIGPHRFGRRLMDWPVLAYERVRFIGDRVAAIAGESKSAVEEALQLIQVEYEELPPVFDAEAALSDGAPLLHENAGEYVYLGKTRNTVPHPNLQGYQLVQKGNEDIEAALAGADRVFDFTFRTTRQHQGYIEPHACVVWIEPDQTVRVITTNKSPFTLRAQMAACIGIRPETIVVDANFIGGDFGGKGLSIDEFACYFLARETGRPIKAVMSYVDELQATNPRHAAVIRLRTGVSREGRLLAHHAEVLFDGGAYAGGKPSDLLVLGGGLASLAAYNVPNTRLEIKTAYTNTVPGGHMRAPGETQTLFAGESHVDMMARELGIDPLEFRLMNVVRQGDRGPADEIFREARAVEVLETAAREIGWDRPRKENRGRGLAVGVRHVGGGKTSLQFTLRPDGVIEVLTGVPDQGSGSFTVIRRVAATVLSIAPERIHVVKGDTRDGPVDPGAGGSRVTHIIGRAAQEGGKRLKDHLEELAAEVMGWPAGKVHLMDDHFVLADQNGESVAFEEVARQIGKAGPVQEIGEYDGSGHGHDEPGDFNFFAYGVEVEVDRDTGQIKVCDVVLAADVGVIINPTAHQGQLEGGFMMGFGTATMEELVVEDGKVTTLGLSEYKLPTQMDTPPFRAVLLKTEVGGPGPFGAKMAGELTNTAVPAAIANAIDDAVGVRLLSFPLTAERIRKALQQDSH